MKLEKVAVVGASGYSGEELIGILSRHPGVDLVCVTSRQHAGQTIEGVLPRFQGTKFSALEFAPSTAAAVAGSGAAFAFLALPHGLAAEFANPLLAAGLRVIDLSADFRVKDPAVYADFYGGSHPAPELLGRSVYGMPEIHRDEIRGAELVAAPGCYPTTVILPLHPLLKQRLIEPRSIVANSLSGVSGAGKKIDAAYLFAECNENARAYGLPKHRHLSEIEQELAEAAAAPIAISFAPHLIPLSRGILTTIHVAPARGIAAHEIDAALRAAYETELFVRVQSPGVCPALKNVVQTNFLDLGWVHDPRTGRMVLMSAIDNLVKGAAGQAVQCFNLMCGWPEAVAL